VRLGRSRGDFVVVISGLKAGQTVVTTGAFKLHNGGVVIVDNKLSPAFSLTPKPEDS
jgi:membrane fusion protein (multidrug efflux system)